MGVKFIGEDGWVHVLEATTRPLSRNGTRLVETGPKKAYKSTTPETSWSAFDHVSQPSARQRQPIHLLLQVILGARFSQTRKSWNGIN